MVFLKKLASFWTKETHGRLQRFVLRYFKGFLTNNY